MPSKLFAREGFRWADMAGMAQDEIKHDPHSGQFTSGQSEAHTHLTEAGHEHKGRDDKTGSHHYEHPVSKLKTEVRLNGSAGISSPPLTNYKKTSSKNSGPSSGAGRITPAIAKNIAEGRLG